MGAVVGAAYALRTDWYQALLEFADAGFPGALRHEGPALSSQPSKLRQMASGAKAMWHLGRGWGADQSEVEFGRAALRSLLGGSDLRAGRIPVAVSTTDLVSGDCVVIKTGPAYEAVYASSALAGVLPPYRKGDRLLADGAYTDICPIDVAREYGHEAIVAVNPGRSDVVGEITSGLQAILRATEICYMHHAGLRFDEADVVIRPPFRRAIDTLDFAAYRECVAAGVRGVRVNSQALAGALKRP
jgi:NTE family protein